MSPRARRSRLALTALLALLGLAASETSSGSLLVPHPHLALELIVEGAPVGAAPALRVVARLLEDEIGLPLPARIVARVYDGPRRFQQALVTHAALQPARAAEFARFATGATLPGLVLLRAPTGTGASSGDWPRLIAHELTHLAQIELAGTDIGPAQWLCEGMAEWVAYRVVERMGLDDFERRRAIARTAAAEYLRRAGGLDLDALTTPDGFVSTHRRVGTAQTYGLTFHLTDDLARRCGFQCLVGYFQSFRASDDADENFAASFGGPPSDFGQAALRDLANESAPISPDDRRTMPVVPPSGLGGST